MDDNSSEQPFVAPDTDDLDAFNSLLHGKAKPAEPKEPEAPVEDNAQPSNNDTLEGADEIIEEPKPKKKTAKDRIDELTAEKYELIRKLEEAAKKPEDKETEQKAPVQPSGAPTAEDLNEDGSVKYALGDFDPQFIRDLTKFTIAQETNALEARRKAEDAEAQRQQYVNTLNSEWQGRVVEAEKTMPDFREKGVALESQFASLDPQYGEFLASTIKSLDVGPEVLYHLANNIDEAQRIVAAGPIGAALALGKLAAKFDVKEQPKPRVSSAPEPAKVTSRGMAVGGQVQADTDDLDAFEQAFYQKK